MSAFTIYRYKYIVGEQEPNVCPFNSDNIKGICVGFMLLGANRIKINDNIKISVYNTRLLSKKQMLECYSDFVSIPSDFYVRWTESDTKDSSDVKIVKYDYNTGNVVCLGDPSRYAVSVPHELSNDFLKGLMFVSSVTGLYYDYIFRVNGAQTEHLYLSRFPLCELPEELVDIIISYTPGSFYAVNRKHYMSVRLNIVKSRTIPNDRKMRWVNDVISGPQRDETEQVIKSYLEFVDKVCLWNSTLIHNLYTRELCEAHYNRLGCEEKLWYNIVINSIYTQLMIDKKYKPDVSLYDTIDELCLIYREHKDYYKELMLSTKLLIDNDILITDPTVGSAIGHLSNEDISKYIDKLSSTFNEPNEFFSHIGLSLANTFNVVMLLELKNRIPQDAYIESVSIMYHNYKCFQGIPSAEAEELMDKWRQMYSDPILFPHHFELVSPDVLSVKSIKGVRLGLLENPNFKDFHNALIAMP